MQQIAAERHLDDAPRPLADVPKLDQLTWWQLLALVGAAVVCGLVWRVTRSFDGAVVLFVLMAAGIYIYSAGQHEPLLMQACRFLARRHIYHPTPRRRVVSIVRRSVALPAWPLLSPAPAVRVLPESDSPGAVSVSWDDAGIMTRPDGSLCAAIRVTPINLTGRIADDQARIAGLFGEMCAALQPGQRIQIIVDNRAVEAREIVDALDDRQQATDGNPDVAAYLEARRGWFLRRLTDTHVSDRQYYLVIEAPRHKMRLPASSPLTKVLRRVSGHIAVDTSREDLLHAIDDTTYYLDAMGLDHEVERDGAALYRALVGAAPEPGQALTEALTHVVVTREDGRRQYARTLYALAPRDKVYPGWLGRLAALPFRSRLVLHIEGRDQDSEVRRLEGMMGQAAVLGESDNAAARGALARLSRAQNEYRRLLESEDEDATALLRVSLSVTVLAESRAELARNVARARAALRSMRCRVGGGLCDQLPLYRSMLPLGIDVARHRRRMTARVVSTLFPFTRESPGHATGMPIGLTPAGHELVNLDCGASDISTQQINVVGSPGGGKSVLVNELCLQSWLEGDDVAVMDRSGSYKPLCAFVGGRYVTLLDPIDRPALNLWDVIGVASHQRQKDIVALHKIMLGGSLTRWQAAHLSAGVAYVLSTEERPMERHLVAWLAAQDMPTERRIEVEDIVAGLAPYVGDGDYATMADQPTTVDIDAHRMVVFDTSNFKEQQAIVPLRIVQDAIDLRAQHHPDRVQVVAFDEGWSVIKVASGWLNTLARESRHHNHRVIFSTQGIGDALQDEDAIALFNSLPISVIFKLSDQRSSEAAGDAWIGRIYDLDARELRKIKGLRTIRGQYSQCMLIIKSQESSESRRGVVNITLPPWSLALYKSYKDERDERDAAVARYGSLWAAICHLVGREPARLPVAHEEEAA